MAETEDSKTGGVAAKSTPASKSGGARSSKASTGELTVPFMPESSGASEVKPFEKPVVDKADLLSLDPAKGPAAKAVSDLPQASSLAMAPADASAKNASEKASAAPVPRGPGRPRKLAAAAAPAKSVIAKAPEIAKALPIAKAAAPSRPAVPAASSAPAKPIEAARPTSPAPPKVSQPVASEPSKPSVAAAQSIAPASAPAQTSAPEPTPLPTRDTAPAAPASAPSTPTSLPTVFSIKDMTMDMSANINGFQDVMTEAQAKAKAAFEKSTSMLGEAGEFAKGNVEAIIESGKILAEGCQEMGSTLVSEGRSAFESMTGDFKELAAVKSPTEFLKVQSDIARKNFDSAVAYGSKNSEAVLKLMSDAFAPLSGRVSLAVEKARQTAPMNAAI